MNKKKISRCVGFREFEGKCPNVSGTPWSPYWCERCNKLRMVYIKRQLESMIAEMAAKEPTTP